MVGASIVISKCVHQINGVPVWIIHKNIILLNKIYLSFAFSLCFYTLLFFFFPHPPSKNLCDMSFVAHLEDY